MESTPTHIVYLPFTMVDFHSGVCLPHNQQGQFGMHSYVDLPPLPANRNHLLERLPTWDRWSVAPSYKSIYLQPGVHLVLNLNSGAYFVTSLPDD